MAKSTRDNNLWLFDLEAPLLDMGDGDVAQVLLDRLKTQNFALDRLRHELAIEDWSSLDSACVAESF